LEIEAAGKPEAVKVRVEPADPVPIGWPKVGKTAVLEWMIDVKSLIIRLLVAIPLIVIYVRRVIRMPGRQTLWLPLLVAIGSCRRCRRRMSLVRARLI
jgi:hypothetical protein